jgi:hypothetical protein
MTGKGLGSNAASAFNRSSRDWVTAIEILQSDDSQQAYR